MKKLIAAIAAFFSKKAARRQKVERALEIVRKVINDPTLDVITELTKTQIDDQILFWVRKALNGLYDALRDGQYNARLIRNPEKTPQAAVELLSQLPATEREIYLAKLKAEVEKEIV